ncbi:cysteine synthase A [Mogibacterium sp. BX12]|uniref:Cysteine synthase n=2 Tax=Zhenpiania hominis TaxID=2763644 RepID=A0A923SS72_9FIRM|nr:cysteine synthase A [Zhenpiania hominis]MBC6680069.1 cysteine synthase A [Zhenpiania hominis]
MKIRESVTELIGNTPLLRLRKIEKRCGAKAALIAKVELFNPGGSAKDRVGWNMIRAAEEDGRLKTGGTIIEPTSGNTGVGIAMVAAAKGYRAIMTMPESMSVERRNLLKVYGAELVLTDAAKGMQGAVDKAEELANEIPGSIIAGQFVNPANWQIHYETTGPEIWRDTDGAVDIFVSAVGTGGTITGVGTYLKEQNPKIKVVAVEPEASPLLSQGKAGPHKIQGIGANFIPEVLDTSVYDEIIAVSDDAAFDTMKELAVTEGLFTGISSGAALYAARELVKREENRGKNVVVLLPDTGERYLSLF